MKLDELSFGSWKFVFFFLIFEDARIVNQDMIISLQLVKRENDFRFHFF